ncbi:MAG: pyridoxal phosphate-dependent aminotransferase [Clostridiales bacterium]|nr:pyridoxal phosphate-dependent aminotransferase [Clostridiales bacterium]MDD7347599.1 pyridoxal phosphate-dependent aminotransferase [Clostridiales bacterium]
MKYDFNKTVAREDFCSVKYDNRGIVFGRHDVIPLWIADMDFTVAEPIVRACERRTKHGIFGYTSRPDDYYRAAASFMERRHGWNVPIETLSFCPGIVPALYSLIQIMSKPGDKILLQTPVYNCFHDVIKASEDRILLSNKLVKTEKGEFPYEIDFKDFEEKLSLEKPALFLLCNPHNPVGRVWTPDELFKMHRLCLEYNVPVISDEIHGDLELFGHKYTPSHTLGKEISKNTVVCFSASKTFNLAGLQASNLSFGNTKWKSSFDSYWSALHLDLNNCYSVEAFKAAWLYGDEWLDELLKYLEGNMIFIRDYAGKYIPELSVYLPEASYLMWLDFSSLNMTQDELCVFLVEEAGVGLSDGRSFDPDAIGFMRMNVASPRSVIERAMYQIREAVAKRRAC